MWIFTPMVDNINQDVLMLVLPIFVFKLVFGTFSMVKALLYLHIYRWPSKFEKVQAKKGQMKWLLWLYEFHGFFFFFVIVCVFSESYDFYGKYFINIFHEFFCRLVFKIYYSVACCVIFIQFKRITMAL